MHKIILDSIEISNFLSIGPPVVFDFHKHYGLNYIFGLNRDIDGVRNGVGKTTIMLDSILFALFGKTSRDIPNKYISNRQMPHKQPVIVNLSFRVNDDSYLIESGMNMPGSHCYAKLYKNKADITKATLKETRSFIEQEILRGSFDIFKNSIFLSAIDSQKFFSMNKASKRIFIEGIFNLQVFGDMLHNIRVDINLLDRSILTEQNVLKELKLNLDDYIKKDAEFEKEKEKLLSEMTAKIAKKKNFLLELDGKIAKEAEIQKKLEIEDLDELQETLKKYTTAKSKIDSLIAITNNDITNHKNIIDKYKDILKELCTDCNAKLVDKLNITPAQTGITDGETKVLDLDGKSKTLQTKITELNTKIKENKDKKTTWQTAENNITAHKLMIAHQQGDIKDLTERHTTETNKSTPFKELIAGAKSKLTLTENTLNDYYTKKKYLDILELSVSEEGAKKYIIKDLIQVLNGRIKKYLDQMGALYTCLFDEAFNCDFITETGICTYENFSTGEKARINTAVIFAFRDILLNLGTMSSSILVLDEFFDMGLDNYAINSIIKILKEINEKSNQTVYIISQRECMAEEDFNNIIRIEKQSGFTQISSDPQGEV